MICKVCNFDNKEDAVYCENCGNKLKSETEVQNQNAKVNTENDNQTVLLNEVVTDNTGVDDSEADTTVLTSEADNMFNPTEIPMGFVMQPGTQVQPGTPMQSGTTFQPEVQLNTQDKIEKNSKTSKHLNENKSGKIGTGLKVYIVLSGLVIIGLIGVIIFGYINYNDKISQLEVENSDKQTEIDDYKDQVASNETEIDDLESQITSLNEDLDAFDDQITNYESQISTLESSQQEYAVYDSLIDFANGSTGQGYSDMFCSDTILHIKKGESVDVKVYYPSAEGTITFKCKDKSVAKCEWNEEWENEVVATLKVTAAGSGNTTITLSNDQNDEKITIYVYVD